MGKADLTEKNLLRYKDVFSDVANVNLFHGEKVLAEEDIVEEQTELIFKSPVYVWKTKVIYVILCRLETWGISM